MIGLEQERNKAYRFEAKGKVVEAEWNTRNHRMHLFKIRENAGIALFHFPNIILEEGQIKIGDSFVKEKNSNFCKVNGIKIKCVS